MKHVGALLIFVFCGGAPAIAQDAANPPLVGVLRINTPDTIEPAATQFRAALAALGWVDGRTVRLENRLTEGQVERLPELAHALVTENARVIVPFGDPATVRRSRRPGRSRSLRLPTTSSLRG